MIEGYTLTQQEAAARLGITPEALRKWRRFGRGPKFLRLGQKLIRYREEDIEAFIAANVVAPEAREVEA